MRAPTSKDFALAKHLGSSAILIIKNAITFCSLEEANRDAAAFASAFKGQIKIYEVKS